MAALITYAWMSSGVAPFGVLSYLLVAIPRVTRSPRMPPWADCHLVDQISARTIDEGRTAFPLQLSRPGRGSWPRS